MNAVVVCENRFDQTEDGTVWTPNLCSYSFMTRYLSVFNKVKLFARVRRVNNVPEYYIRVDGPNVEVIALPYYIGPLQFILNYFKIKKIMDNAKHSKVAIILRVPSPIAGTITGWLIKTRYPYGLEVVGDPYGTFAPGAINHPLRILLRWWFTRKLKQQCAHAAAVAYVTKNTLQKRYPTGVDAFSTNCSSYYSDVELDKNVPLTTQDILKKCNRFNSDRMFNIIMIGTLEQYYKAPDIALKAISICKKRNANIHLTLIGGGKLKSALEDYAKELNIQSIVAFSGQLPKNEVLIELDKADIFIMPSRQEGLPRAMIEAMSRGLPCIGTNIGGIPELLNPDDLIAPNNAEALADKICEILKNNKRLCEMALRNFEISKEYSENILKPKRNSFYNCISNRTEEWLRNRLN